MSDKLRVGISELQISEAPAVLVTYGLGSCLGITLYDPELRLGGMAHTLLPTVRPERREPRPAKFVDSALTLMLEQMLERGASRERLQAKVVGGANMFASLSPSGDGGVGARNIQAARAALEQLEIPLLAEDVGGHHGRTVEFDLASGEARVRSVRGRDKLLIL